MPRGRSVAAWVQIRTAPRSKRKGAAPGRARASPKIGQSDRITVGVRNQHPPRRGFRTVPVRRGSQPNIARDGYSKLDGSRTMPSRFEPSLDRLPFEKGLELLE